MRPYGYRKCRCPIHGMKCIVGCENYLSMVRDRGRKKRARRKAKKEIKDEESSS